MREFLDSNVLTSGMELLLSQAFARLAGTGSSGGIYELSESMGGGKIQSMIVAGILARFPHLSELLPFRDPPAKAEADLVAPFTGRATDAKVRVALGEALGVRFPKASAVIERPTMKVREQILASYPFHFSTKHLIASFNDNPGFQKTRDVIGLMATVVRSLWSKGETEVARHHLLSLETTDLNDSNVASRFVEIKKSLQDAMQTDIANSGTSHAETLDAETGGLASRCAKWIFSASLSEVHPRGLTGAHHQFSYRLQLLKSDLPWVGRTRRWHRRNEMDVLQPDSEHFSPSPCANLGGTAKQSSAATQVNVGTVSSKGWVG